MKVQKKESDSKIFRPFKIEVEFQSLIELKKLYELLRDAELQVLYNLYDVLDDEYEEYESYP